ncbi:TlpA disulfide reductase family protein [Sulfuriflexus mobilis]|uniref:TlpA disulfide reductase family protein n=1 Tax=Sulfuriflexus mobilis TaxID=1811807 RepID=UPI000F839105|nr:TlpA disulfide reductase family protein [Sulfuriflexus mobilis]
MIKRFPEYSLFFLLLFCQSVKAASEYPLTLSDGSELLIERYMAAGEQLFIWLAPEAGLQQAERNTASRLAESGIEVWYPDLFEANFLPVVASSMDKIPAEQLAGLVEAASKTGKQVYVVTSGRGVIPVLRGLRQWQTQHPSSDSLRGLILISPKFFLETPEPGQAAEIMPVVKASNLPIFVMQPDKSPWWWKLEQTIPALEQGGSEVFVRALNGVRDRFYYRPDATAFEDTLAEKLPSLLLQAAKLVSTLEPKRQAVLSKQPLEDKIAVTKKERELKVYGGNPTPPPLSLLDLFDKRLSLADYKGKVVLVNFWASWCPPCVYEMPSMQRLADKLRDKPFEILAINMAEDKATIQRFVTETVQVDFPIMLDSDGTALKNWGVFAFPTTYVIGKQGKIRYALFGSREWDEPDVLAVLDKLMSE